MRFNPIYKLNTNYHETRKKTKTGEQKEIRICLQAGESTSATEQKAQKVISNQSFFNSLI